MRYHHEFAPGHLRKRRDSWLSLSNDREGCRQRGEAVRRDLWVTHGQNGKRLARSGRRGWNGRASRQRAPARPDLAAPPGRTRAEHPRGHHTRFAALRVS